MQEFLILFTMVLAIFFWVFGARTQTWIWIALAGVFFALIGTGLFVSGWERLQGDALLTKISATVITVEQTTVTFEADSVTNPAIWAFANICIILTLALIVSSAKTYKFVQLATVDDDAKIFDQHV